MAKLNCNDFLQFQEQLKLMRIMDDKIIYALNTSIPTESFKGQASGENGCKELYYKIENEYRDRQDAIKDCILITADNVKALKENRLKNNNDIKLEKTFKSEQRKLRLLQSELNVEEILKEKTYKTFNERCRLFFRADAL